MLNYLMNCLTSIESVHQISGILLLGDFNKFNVAKLKSSFHLKQIVTFATKGRNTLDLVLTNLQDFYNFPDRRPPFGLFDHMSIQVKPKLRSELQKPRFTVKSRDLRPNKRLAIQTYLQEVNIPTFTNSLTTCAQKASLLETIIKTDLDMLLPLRSITVHSNDPPWINPALKYPIRRRQRALAQGNLPCFRLIRNRVNRERKTCWAKYYEAKVNHLKVCKPSMWWKEVKELSGSRQHPEIKTMLLNYAGI